MDHIPGMGHLHPWRCRWVRLGPRRPIIWQISTTSYDSYRLPEGDQRLSATRSFASADNALDSLSSTAARTAAETAFEASADEWSRRARESVADHGATANSIEFEIYKGYTRFRPAMEPGQPPRVGKTENASPKPVRADYPTAWKWAAYTNSNGEFRSRRHQATTSARYPFKGRSDCYHYAGTDDDWVRQVSD